MTSQQWTTLLYPLGFMANLLFGSRFLLHWIRTERNPNSAISPSFWYISTAGSLVMVVHSWIQFQYPVALLHALSCVLYFRNLDLSRTPHCRMSFSWTVRMQIWIALSLTAAFATRAHLMPDSLGSWLRVPTTPWEHAAHIKPHFLLSFIGCSGVFLFAIRFFVQWWTAEKKSSSELYPAFWWLSFIGAILCLTYFVPTHDWVNVIGYGTGLILYGRQLMLVQKSRKEKPSL